MVNRVLAFFGIAAIATGLCQAALTGAPTAAASSVDDVFIAAITKQGIQPPSSKEAVGEAHNVCAMLDGGAGLADTIDAVAEDTGLKPYNSGFFVGVSIGIYCPEHTDLVENASSATAVERSSSSTTIASASAPSHVIGRQ